MNNGRAISTDMISCALRPDLHVVWRGNRLPERPEQLAPIATGH